MAQGLVPWAFGMAPQEQQNPQVGGQTNLFAALQAMLPQLLQHQQGMEFQQRTGSKLRISQTDQDRRDRWAGMEESNRAALEKDNARLAQQKQNQRLYFEGSPAHQLEQTYGQIAQGNVPKARVATMEQDPSVFGMNPEGNAQNIQGGGWGLMLGTGENSGPYANTGLPAAVNPAFSVVNPSNQTNVPTFDMNNFAPPSSWGEGQRWEQPPMLPGPIDPTTGLPQQTAPKGAFTALNRPQGLYGLTDLLFGLTPDVQPAINQRSKVMSNTLKAPFNWLSSFNLVD